MRIRSSVALALLLAVPAPALAHLQIAQGRLLDLIQRSDRVLIAKVRAGASPEGQGMRLLPVALPPTATAPPTLASIEIPARLAVEVGRTYAFFVKRDGERWQCVHANGTVLPARAGGSEYIELDRALRPLLRSGSDEVTDVLILALRSSTRELRQHATLALLDVVHADHPLTAAQRESLRATLAAVSFPAQFRPVLESLLHQ